MRAKRRRGNKYKSDFFEKEYFNPAYLLTEKTEEGIILNYFPFDGEIGEIIEIVKKHLPEELQSINESLSLRLRILDQEKNYYEEKDSVSGKNVVEWIKKILSPYEVKAFSVRIDITGNSKDKCCYRVWMFEER